MAPNSVFADMMAAYKEGKDDITATLTKSASGKIFVLN
jgi:hypothetical protein